MTADPHAPALPPVTLLHVTVTADTGTVAQLVNEAAEPRTFRFQVLAADPPDVVQLTVAAELPATLTRSGSVAVKLIVPGLAETEATLVASGNILFAAGTTILGFCSAITAEQPHIQMIPVIVTRQFMWR